MKIKIKIKMKNTNAAQVTRECSCEQKTHIGQITINTLEGIFIFIFIFILIEKSFSLKKSQLSQFKP